MNRFKGKVVFITGAASGIGRAVAELLATKQAHLVLTDIDQDGVLALCESLAGRGFSAESHPLDVTNERAVTTLIQQTAQQHGQLDYIFNNAGIGITGEVRDMSVDDWRKVVEVNLMGVIHGTNAAYKIMIEQGQGHIVNTASASGLVGLPFATPYAATKGAVVLLSNSLRMEARPLGVKVSAICPGFVKTNIYDNATLVNTSLNASDDIPFRMMEVEKAAEAILRGVERNQAMIVFPAHAKLLWALERLSHRLVEFIGRPSVRKQLKRRQLTEKMGAPDDAR